MQAIATWYYDNELSLKPTDVAAVAVALADALIKQLERPPVQPLTPLEQASLDMSKGARDSFNDAIYNLDKDDR